MIKHLDQDLLLNFDLGECNYLWSKEFLDAFSNLDYSMYEILIDITFKNISNLVVETGDEINRYEFIIIEILDFVINNNTCIINGILDINHCDINLSFEFESYKIEGCSVKIEDNDFLNARNEYNK